MNTKRWIAVWVAVIATGTFFSPQSAWAQNPVAIVDIGEIFKNHPNFSQQLDGLKQKADAFKASSIQAQQDLIQKAEVLKNFTPGSPDYQAEEAKLAKESATMEVEQKLAMRELMQAEARLHFDTYEQVNQLIEQYCDSRGIHLVLRYNSQKMDPNNPATVMQRVNSSVIFHNPATDITSIVIGQLNGQANANPSLVPNRR